MKTRKIILTLMLAFIALVLIIVYFVKSNNNIDDLS